VELVAVQVFTIQVVLAVDEVVTVIQVILVAEVQEVAVADETALLVQAFLEKEILAHLVMIEDPHSS
jgi:hypothetical protein